MGEDHGSFRRGTKAAGARVMARFIVVLAVLSLLAPISPAPAEACGNAYIRRYVLPIAIRKVERVEALMAEGNVRGAHRIASDVARGVIGARAMDHDHDELTPGFWAEGIHYGDDPSPEREALLQTRHPERAAAIERRAKLLRAILVVRLDGQVTRDGNAARRVHPAVRMEQLTRAQADLASLVVEGEEEPRLAAYLAEANARLDPAAAPASLATLQNLASRDLVGDPLTWVALARLETDPGAREVALERCRTIVTRRADRVCVVPEA